MLVTPKLAQSIGLDEGLVGIRPERQLLQFGEQTLSCDDYSLKDYQIGPCATIHLRDLGQDMPVSIAKILVYTGPIVIYHLFAQYHYRIYSTVFEPETFEATRGPLVLWEENSMQ